MRPLAPPHQSKPTLFYYPGSNQAYVRSQSNPGSFVKYGASPPHTANVVTHSVAMPHTTSTYVSSPNMGGGIRQSLIGKSIYSGPGGLPHPASSSLTMTSGIHGGGGASSSVTSTVSQYTSGQGTLTPQLRGGIFTIWLAKFVGDIVALFGG